MSEDAERTARAVCDMVELTANTTFPGKRAAGIARMLSAAAGSIDRLSPGGLFDTEPANLRSLLESSPGAVEDAS